jgi:hypothetical protein
MEQGLSGYAGCRLGAFSKDSRHPDATKLASFLASCRARFEAAMYKAQARFGTLGCTETSVAQLRVYVETFADTASAAAGGAERLPEPCAVEPCAVVDNGKGGTYTDNCNGTVTDSTTGLVWEQKTADVDHGGIGTWSGGSPWDFNGTAVSVFLAALNTAPCFAGSCNWRLPTIEELSGRSLLSLEEGWGGYATGGIVDFTAPGCDRTAEYGPPCINAIFGPTNGGYWSSTPCQGVACGVQGPEWAWGVDFSHGLVFREFKPAMLLLRAVRRQGR